MTKEERHLWYDFLKSLPVTFKRQYVIKNYIVDFCCESKKIIIELDGSQHYESQENAAKDQIRDKQLKELGYRVLRFDNLEVYKNFSGVCDTIYYYIFNS